MFTKERKQSLHQTGETKVAKHLIQSVNLDTADPKIGEAPTVEVDVCFDVIDKNRKSVVRSDGPDTGWIKDLASNYVWTPIPIADRGSPPPKHIERTPCAAS